MDIQQILTQILTSITSILGNSAQLLNYVPAFNFGSIIFILISTILGTIIIYLWMSVFHEAPTPSHAFFVALIANLQNYFVPFLSFLFVIPYMFQIFPLLLWIILIKIFYSDLDIKHVVIISVLCWGTHTVLEMFGVALMIQSLVLPYLPL